MRVKRRALTWACLAALAILVAAGPARPQVCSATMTDFNFGTTSVRAGNQPRIMGNLVVDCTALLGLVSLANVCITFGPGGGGAGPSNNPRYMVGPGGQLLSYQLYRSSYGGTPLTSITGVSLGLLSPTYQETIYAQVESLGNSVNGGYYQSNFAVPSDFRMTAGTLLSCTTYGQQDTSPFTVSANIVPSCTVSAGTLNFGSVGTNIQTPVAAQTSLTLTCSSGTTYSVLLGPGQGAGVSDPTVRKMAYGTNSLAYGLYRNQSMTAPWGWTAGTNDFTGTGTGSPQSITVYGKINGGQTVPTGIYNDSVVITVNY